MRLWVASENPEQQDEVLPEPDVIQLPVWYVVQTWVMFKVHHIFPRAGGYDDQDELLMQDWHTLNLYYARVRTGIVSSVFMGSRDNAVSWRDSGLMDG